MVDSQMQNRLAYLIRGVDAQRPRKMGCKPISKDPGTTCFHCRLPQLFACMVVDWLRIFDLTEMT